MCFVFIWEQTATCATYSINWLFFITKMKSVYSAVRTGSLTKAVCALSLTLRWLMSYIYGAPILDVSRSHNDAQQSVGLLWTSDQLVAETSTWQHTTLTTDKYPCPQWEMNPRSQQASGCSPAEILGSNPTGGMDICLLWLSCVVR